MKKACAGSCVLSVFQKGFGSLLLFGAKVRILRVTLGKRKAVDGFGKAHDEIVGADVCLFDGDHGL
jgi:hypothetical protein